MSKLLSPNGVDLKFCESILYRGAGIFKKHIRWRVFDDRETLQRLLQANEWSALEYYEAFYSEMVNVSQYDQQYDIYNNLHVVIDAGLTTNESIYERFYDRREAVSKVRQIAGKKGGRPSKATKE